MDTKYIVNLSGGKDSTAMLLMLLEKGCPVDYILFADTGKDFPQMQEHLRKLAEYIKEHHPTAPEITILKHEKGFDYMMFEHRKCRGKYKDTPGNGWASFRNRWCTSRLKLDVIYKYCKTLACDCVHFEMDARACNQFKPGYTVAELPVVEQNDENAETTAQNGATPPTDGGNAQTPNK